MVISGNAAGANLQLRLIAAGGIDNVAETIQLPEPAAIASLTAGWIGLGLLYGHRRRRSNRDPSRGRTSEC